MLFNFLPFLFVLFNHISAPLSMILHRPSSSDVYCDRDLIQVMAVIWCITLPLGYGGTILFFRL